MKNELVERLANDIGGLEGGAFQRTEHPMLPWEKRCHALADVRDFHKLTSTEEKRRGVEALSAELIGKLSYYERWVVAFSNLLFAKQLVSPDELARKMQEVESRMKAV